MIPILGELHWLSVWQCIH